MFVEFRQIGQVPFGFVKFRQILQLLIRMLGIFREKQHTSCVKCFENVKLKNPIGFLERRIEKNLIAPQALCLNKPFFRSWLNDFDFIKKNSQNDFPSLVEIVLIARLLFRFRIIINI